MKMIVVKRNRDHNGVNGASNHLNGTLKIMVNNPPSPATISAPAYCQL